jgi:RNA polymerase sigma-70 factor (ECF subfamily)
VVADRIPPDAPDGDLALMARVRDGDREAFERLYERTAPVVMRFLFGLCQDRQLAEDLTQDTFLAAWVAAPRWRPKARVTTWLLAMGKRLAWKRLRRRARRPGLEARAAARPGAPEQAPDPGAEARDEAARLGAAVRTLTPPLRAVFVLVRLADRSYAETAEIVGVPVGTVKSRMAAAEARLRRELGA